MKESLRVQGIYSNKVDIKELGKQVLLYFFYLLEESKVLVYTVLIFGSFSF